MTALLIKVTLLFLTALVAVLATRRSTAAMRCLLCVCALAGSLILPIAALLPSPARMPVFRFDPFRIVTNGSQTFASATAWPSARVFLWLWVVGSGLLLFRLAAGYWRIHRAIRSATPIEHDVYAAEVSVPIASGLLQPVVLMPRASADWPEWQRAAAVRHERAHIERRDLVANFVAHLACALYWFHPLAWVLFSLLRREQETACDDAVLHSGLEPATYAEALLAVARNSTSTLFAGCAMTTQIDVKNRILRLLDAGIARTTSPRILRFAAIASAALVLAIGVNVRAQSDQPAAEPGQVYHVGGDVQSPRVVAKVDPAYTEEARAQKLAGTVRLSMVIGTDGLAHDISVLQGIGLGLDENAVEAVQKWHFAPGTLKGEPVAVQAVVEVNFKLL